MKEELCSICGKPMKDSMSMFEGKPAHNRCRAKLLKERKEANKAELEAKHNQWKKENL